LTSLSFSPKVGQEVFCQVDRDGDFEFIHPKTTCNLSNCTHYNLCNKWEIEQLEKGILPKAKSIFEGLGLDWYLPGNGTSYSDCGDWRYRGCLNVADHHQDQLDQHVEGKIYVEWYRRSCYRAECPVCYEKWAGKEAGKIEHRLKFFWKYGKVIHVANSPILAPVSANV